ncbi:ATP-binding response regulator [Desulfobacula toluolica]|uniref:histidine kinase n=1 Tax=Desulfobacula toluolica (strain DSM 7467 / Tol2) TaxID=651182 RepID=K0NC99_DESTT|nr:response regulator [Desulfobacula toluolica]CCK78441.1 response regulator protein [Desulfobacula toluolica Tol2]
MDISGKMGNRILIIDDGLKNIQLIGTVLRDKGYAVSIAQSGSQGLNVIQQDKPDLILLDIMMPEMDGFETCRRLKKNPEVKNIPVIFLSALTDTVNKVEGFKIGAVDYITKPVNAEELMARIKTHLTIKSLRYELENANIKLEEKILERTRELALKNQALMDIKEKYQILVESANDSIFVAQDNVIKFSNRKTEELTGYAKDELIKTPFIDFVHPDDRAKVLDRYAKRLTGKNPVSTYSFKIISKSGVEKTVHLNTVLIQWENRPATLNFLRDITQIIKIESQLQQSQKMEIIGTLAGGIAHDFNNILFPIIGHAEMLLEDIPEDSLFRDSLDEIYASTLRAKDLVKQILTFSRQESPQLTLMKMQPIVREALKLVRSSIPTTIKIKQDINSACGVIKADPTRIHQIVMNLATNAYHSMEDTGGELKVSLDEIELSGNNLIMPEIKPGVYACLTIADTGMGMDKVVAKKIFDPFFTTKKKGKGTGMGLSVVHGIVKGMKGDIRFHSKPGKGTEFYVYLPIVKKSTEIINTQVKERIQGTNERILLVDDEESIIKMEKKILERLGYQVSSHISSIEALKTFRAAPDTFDLVITDMAMPNMSGDRLSVELMKIRTDIPILLCTGFNETISEKKVVSLGIKGLLIKPIAMKELSKKICEVLDKIKIESPKQHLFS